MSRLHQAIYASLRSLYETDNYEVINRWASVLYDEDGCRVLSNWTQENLYRLQHDRLMMM